MVQSKSSGFAAIEAVLIFVVVGILGFTGWFVWNAKQNTEKTLSDAANSQPGIIKAQKKVATETTKTYTNVEYKFSFQHPSSWKLVTDLKDIGRGGLEGDIYVESPSGTKVYFSPNFGGKGGDCIDEQAGNQYTTRTCTTRNILSVDKLSTSTSQDVYLVKASDTYPTSGIDGGKTVFFVQLSSSTKSDTLYEIPKVGSALGVFLGTYDNVRLEKGYLSVSVEGKDDAKNSSAAFFDSDEIKEAIPVLTSFKTF